MNDVSEFELVYGEIRPCVCIVKKINDDLYKRDGVIVDCFIVHSKW